jgi:hypothetical protein
LTGPVRPFADFRFTRLTVGGSIRQVMPMRFTPNVVVGLALTTLGTVLLLDQLGFMDAQSVVRFWPVLLVLFGASVVVEAMAPRPEGEPVRQSRPIVGPGAIFFVLILWMLSSNAFPDRRFVSSGAAEDPEVTLVAVLGRDERVSLAAPFRDAQMTSVMGRTRLDLRQATIAPGESATVDVFGVMGAVDVIVPESWTVEVQTTAVMGGVSDRRRGRDRNDDDNDDITLGPDPAGAQAGAPLADAETTPPRIVLRGLVVFGGLIIRS